MGRGPGRSRAVGAFCKGLATSHYFAVSVGRPVGAVFRILSSP